MLKAEGVWRKDNKNCWVNKQVIGFVIRREVSEKYYNNNNNNNNTCGQKQNPTFQREQSGGYLVLPAIQ